MMPDLSGACVLIVEDEYFIASDLKQALQKVGAAVLGPAATPAAAMKLIDDRLPDVGVLDVNLDAATSYAIADRLAGGGRPFLFLTGYDRGSMPEAYRDAVHITKPFSILTVIERVAQLVHKEANQ